MKPLALICFCAALHAEPVTFTKHIAPILFEHCAPCHRPGEAAPFSLLTYEDARHHATQIVSVTERRYMPPWLPVPGHGDFVGARRLRDEQISLLARWAQTGMSLGDPADLPSTPKFVEGWQLGEPDLVLRMPQPYQLPAQAGDIFRNFVLPISLSQTKYVRAIEIRPSSKRLVHHANLIVDRARMLRKRDGEDGNPGFPGMEVETETSGEFDPDSHFLFWKPGSVPRQEPADMAWRLDPGSDLIANLHLQPSGKDESVDVVVGLYFTERAPTRFPMLLQLEHDGAIDIPPGSADFSVSDHFKLPIAVDLLAIYPHAHYLGKHIEAWAELPGGKRLSLLQIDDWDINWQATFTYRNPISLPAGTLVAMRIVYDNTAQNPRNPSSPLKRVRAGNRSEDEMGHVWLQVLPSAPRMGKNSTRTDVSGDAPRLLLQEAVMRRRIEKYPGDFTAHFNLGAALQALGKQDEALSVLRTAVRIDPSNATARNNLAVSLLSADKPDDAIREWRESLALNPGYQNARYNLAHTLAERGDTFGALAELRIYLQAIPEDAQAQELAGRVYAATGKVPESLPYFRKAAELQPKDAAMQANLGVALAQAGQLKEAIAAFEAAQKIDPQNQVVQANLARARASLGGKP